MTVNSLLSPLCEGSARVGIREYEFELDIV